MTPKKIEVCPICKTELCHITIKKEDVFGCPKCKKEVSRNDLEREVNVTLKLKLLLPSHWDTDEIVTFVRGSLPDGLGDTLTNIPNPVDIIEVK